MSYDKKCYELAAAFLSEEPGLNSENNRSELAQIIQDDIEDFIDMAEQQF
jgi:hypothetical protein